MRNPNIDSSDLISSFQQVNRNLYSNLSYHESLGKNWKIDASAAYNYYRDKMSNQLLNKENQPSYPDDYPYTQQNFDSLTNSDFAQARVVLRKQLIHNQAIRFGAEYFYSKDQLAS